MRATRLSGSAGTVRVFVGAARPIFAALTEAVAQETTDSARAHMAAERLAVRVEYGWGRSGGGLYIVLGKPF